MKSSLNIVNRTISGRCSCCGECCSDILHLDSQEIKKIDDYMKEHKVIQHNKGENNFLCPFRNHLFRKCDIYPVRPYICQLFKCDTPPEKAAFDRDQLNAGKKPRSMAQLFFQDDSNIKFMKDNFGFKLYRRGE